MKTRNYQVLVTGAKCLSPNEDTIARRWSDCEDAGFAINYAAGLVDGLEWANKYTANRPLAPHTDGFWWEFKTGIYQGLRVEVMIEDNGVWVPFIYNKHNTK